MCDLRCRLQTEQICAPMKNDSHYSIIMLNFTVRNYFCAFYRTSAYLKLQMLFIRANEDESIYHRYCFCIIWWVLDVSIYSAFHPPHIPLHISSHSFWIVNYNRRKSRAYPANWAALARANSRDHKSEQFVSLFSRMRRISWLAAIAAQHERGRT